MPKPATLKSRDKSKQALRGLGELLDDDKLLDGIDEIEESADAAAQAREHAMGYFKAKGVRMPPGLENLEIEHGSPWRICATFWGVTCCVGG